MLTQTSPLLILLLGLLLTLSPAHASTKTHPNVNLWNGGYGLLLDMGLLKVDYTYDIELSYTTTQGTGVDPYNSDMMFQEYGFKVFSKLHGDLTLEVFSVYQWVVDGTVIPFEFVPFTQKFAWIRPEVISDNRPFDIEVSGWRDFHALWMIVKLTEQTKTFEKSFLQYFQDQENYKLYPESQDELVYDSPNGSST